MDRFFIFLLPCLVYAEINDYKVCFHGVNICISGYNKTNMKKIEDTVYEYDYEEQENLNLTCTQTPKVRFNMVWEKDGTNITTGDKVEKQMISIALHKNDKDSTYMCRVFEEGFRNPYKTNISITFHHFEKKNLEETSGKQTISTQQPRIEHPISENKSPDSDSKFIIMGIIAVLVLIVIILILILLIWKNNQKRSEAQMQHTSKSKDSAPQNTYKSGQHGNYTNSPRIDRQRLLESSENITQGTTSLPYPDVCEVYAEPVAVSSNYEVYCDPYSAMYTTPVPKQLRAPVKKNVNKSSANSTINNSKPDGSSSVFGTLVKNRDIDYASPAYTSIESGSDANYASVGYNTIEKKADNDYISPVYTTVDKIPKISDKPVTYTNTDKKLAQSDSSTHYTNVNNKSSCANVKNKDTVAYNVDSDTIYSS